MHICCTTNMEAERVSLSSKLTICEMINNNTDANTAAKQIFERLRG